MKEMVRFISNFVKGYKKFYFYNVLVTIVSSILKVSLPLYFKFYLDKLKIDQSVYNIFILFFVFILLNATSNVVSLFWHYITTRLGVNILFKLRKDIADHIERCSNLNLKLFGFEKIKNIIYYDTLEIFRSVVAFISILVANTLVVLFVLGILFFFEKKIFALVCC